MVGFPKFGHIYWYVCSYPYKNIKVVQDYYNLKLVYKVVHNLVVTLSLHCDKLVFETCNSLVTPL